MAGHLDIAGAEIGALEDELELIDEPMIINQKDCTTPKIRRLRRRINAMFARCGETIQFRAPWAVNVVGDSSSVVRQMRSEELVGQVSADDLTFIFEAAPLISAGFTDGMRKGLRAVRYPAHIPWPLPDEPRMNERQYTAINEPALLGANGIPLFWRGVFRG